jgi:hypothetical protein
LFKQLLTLRIGVFAGQGDECLIFYSTFLVYFGRGWVQMKRVSMLKALKRPNILDSVGAKEPGTKEVELGAA